MWHFLNCWSRKLSTVPRILPKQWEKVWKPIIFIVNIVRSNTNQIFSAMWGYLNSLSGTLGTVTEFYQNNKEIIVNVVRDNHPQFIFSAPCGATWTAWVEHWALSRNSAKTTKKQSSNCWRNHQLKGKFCIEGFEKNKKKQKNKKKKKKKKKKTARLCCQNSVSVILS